MECATFHLVGRDVPRKLRHAICFCLNSHCHSPRSIFLVHFIFFVVTIHLFSSRLALSCATFFRRNLPCHVQPFIFFILICHVRHFIVLRRDLTYHVSYFIFLSRFPLSCDMFHFVPLDLPLTLRHFIILGSDLPKIIL